jgi:small-conductance mechanosensitive channel/CRP-like cAMP-binding protein
MRLIAPVLLLLASLLLIWLGHSVLLAAMPREDMLALFGQIGLWLAGAWLAKRLFTFGVHYYARRRLGTGRRSQLLEGGPQLLIDMIGLALLIGVIFIIVGQTLHQPIGGLLATSGLFAAIIGLAIQRMISDVFSGLALNVERPFAVGDWIETASGVAGKIIQANWRAVHLETIEGRAVVIPNSVLANNQFINVNAPERHFRLKKTICLDYSTPGERIVPILDAAMEATPGVCANPKPVVLIEECIDRGVIYSLNFWVDDYPDQFVVSRQVVITALRFLDQAGLSPAYPKRDVTIMAPSSHQIERQVDLPDVLSRVPFLRLLEPEAIQGLAHESRLQEYPTNAVVVREGSPGASLFVIVAGMLDVSRKGDDGVTHTVGRLLPGEVFGEMSLLTGSPRTATVIAINPVTLIEISKSDLQGIFAAHPEMIAELTEIEAARLLANRNALRLTAAEHVEIDEVGVVAFLRRKILSFFGQTDA